VYESVHYVVEAVKECHQTRKTRMSSVLLVNTPEKMGDGLLEGERELGLGGGLYRGGGDRK
jgi:hypothetical protein